MLYRVSSIALVCALTGLAVAGALGCTPTSPSNPPPTPERSRCQLGADPTTTLWRGSILTRCVETTEHSGACEIVRVDADGRARPLDVGDAQGGWELPDARILVHAIDGGLDLVDGAERTRLVEWAAEPELDASGAHVVFVAPGPGVEGAPELGAPTQISRVTLSSGAIEVLWDEPEASLPVPLPNSDDVLAISTRTGFAALYRVSGGQATQLTNLDGAAQGAVPVPGRDWSVSSDGAHLYYSATDSESDENGATVWHLDIEGGLSERIGAGRWVAAMPEGVEVLRPGAEVCRATYTLGGGA